MTYKKSILAACACLSTIGSFGCHFFFDKPLRHTNAGLCLSQNQIIALKERAINGDGDAAFRLSSHYAFNTDWFNPTNRLENIKWLSLAATNGNGPAQYSLGTYYTGKFYPEMSNNENAIFWLSRAATNGYTNAIIELKSIHQP